MSENTPSPAEAEIRQRLESYAAGKDFRLNDDDGTANAVIAALAKRREKFGRDYCPCRRPGGDEEEDGRIVCPCAFHLEEIAKDGRCHCHLFIKS